MEYILKNGKIFYTPERNLLKAAGVYKITFSNGSFYFGSSGNFESRLKVFRGQFNGTTKIDNKKMNDVMRLCRIAFFEIIAIIDDKSACKIQETALIKANYDNPLIINRSFSDVNTGIRWTDTEKSKMSATIIAKIKSGQINRKWKEGRVATRGGYKKRKVILVDFNGEIINEFQSLRDTAAYLNVSPQTIYNNIKRGNSIENGCSLKYG